MNAMLGVVWVFAIPSLLKDVRPGQLVHKQMSHAAMGGRWSWGDISKRRVVQAPKSRNHHRHPKITI